jgi:hypothetical protein
MCKVLEEIRDRLPVAPPLGYRLPTFFGSASFQHAPGCQIMYAGMCNCNGNEISYTR